MWTTQPRLLDQNFKKDDHLVVADGSFVAIPIDESKPVSKLSSAIKTKTSNGSSVMLMS